jgi:hypothetical protein
MWITLAIYAGFLCPLALAAVAAFRWRGGWRLAGFAPLLALLMFVGLVATQSNLWGLVFLPLAPVLCIWCLVTVLGHRKHLGDK